MPDLVDDPADQVGTPRGAGEPAGARLADPEHVADLDGDPLGRRHAGQLDEVHDRLVREAAHQVREPGLAQPAGADDRGDPCAADGLGERGDVAVTPDQPRGLVEQAFSDRPVAGQQLGVQRLQGRARVDAEAVGEVGAVGLVALQRRRYAVHRGERAQQGGQHLRRRGRPARAAAARRRTRRSRPVAGPPGAAPRRRRRRGASAEPVAAGRALDDLGAGGRPGAGDDDLERLGGVGRDVVAPDRLDERRLGQAAGSCPGEAAQQRVGPLARDRLALPGDVVEDREPRQRRSVSAGRHRSARPPAPPPRRGRRPSPPRSGSGRVPGTAARTPATCGPSATWSPV